MSDKAEAERSRQWDDLIVGRTWTGAGAGPVKCFICCALAKLEFKLVGGGFKPDLQYEQPKTIYRVHCETCGAALPVERRAWVAPPASEPAHSSDGQITNLAPPAGQREWISTSEHLPPDGLVVETKSDDEGGCRNEQTLKRSGNLWFIPDGSMYVWRTR